MALPDGTDVAYGYDADGRRVRQVVDGQVTNYLWDEASPYGDVVLETDALGAEQAAYVLGGTELIAQRRNGETSYYLHDTQGSVRALADADGNIVDSYVYSAFGELVDQQGMTVNSYLYAGQQFDTPTGLYSMRARYYDPADGRFLSRDRAVIDLKDASEHNRYVYVANNPVNAIDPTGYTGTAGYGMATSERGEHTVEAVGPTHDAVLQSKELGTRFAVNSRNLTYQLRDKLISQYGDDAAVWMKNVTVGTSEVNGEAMVVINGGARPEVVSTLQSIHPGALQAPGSMHTERFIIERAAQIASQNGTSIGQVIQAIGISNSAGPCPLCAPIAQEIPIFFLGRLLPYLL